MPAHVSGGLKGCSLPGSRLTFETHFGASRVKPLAVGRRERTLVINKYLAETIGTYILVGVGSMAILAVTATRRAVGG